MASDAAVAAEIRRQIGPGVLMRVGARDFVRDASSLTFTAGSRAGGRLEKIVVTLTPSDTYDVRRAVYARSGLDLRSDRTLHGIYNDQLPETIDALVHGRLRSRKPGRARRKRHIGPVLRVRR